MKDWRGMTIDLQKRTKLLESLKTTSAVIVAFIGPRLQLAPMDGYGFVAIVEESDRIRFLACMRIGSRFQE